MKQHPIYTDYYYNDETQEVYCEYLDQVLKPTKHHTGYMVVNLEDFTTGDRKLYKLHRFIMECLLGRELKKNYVVNHIDGNKANNHPSNLEEITIAENTQHAYNHGLAKGKKGSDNASSKLTEDEVKSIPDLRANGMSVRQIASKYGVSVKTVYSILTGKRWKHLIYEKEIK